MKHSIRKTITSNMILLLTLSMASLFADDSATNAQTKETLSYLPGGEEVKKLVEARRGKTELSKEAMKMESGAWVTLSVDSPKRLWSAPSEKLLHIGTWSDDGQWDSRTGQFLYFGVRQARKLVAFSEEKNEWRNIEFEGKPNAPELLQQYGHQYSCNSFDPERSKFYTHLWCYNIQTDTWEETPPYTARRGMVYEYFTAMDGLLSLGLDDKNHHALYFYHTPTKKWSEIVTKSPVHGYHSLARHNPYLKACHTFYLTAT